jgi:hypothetical protein
MRAPFSDCKCKPLVYTFQGGLSKAWEKGLDATKTGEPYVHPNGFDPRSFSIGYIEAKDEQPKRPRRTPEQNRIHCDVKSEEAGGAFSSWLIVREP